MSSTNKNSFHINIDEKPLPGYAQSIQQPMQQTYPHSPPFSQNPYQPNNMNTSNSNPIVNTTVNPTFNPVININTTGVSAPPVSTVPVVVSACQYCGSTLNPVTTYSPGMASYIGGALLFFVFWPLCWIPCVSNSCMDVKDTCQNCSGIRREIKKPWIRYAIALGIIFALFVYGIVLLIGRKKSYYY